MAWPQLDHHRTQHCALCQRDAQPQRADHRTAFEHFGHFSRNSVFADHVETPAWQNEDRMQQTNRAIGVADDSLLEAGDWLVLSKTRMLAFVLVLGGSFAQPSGFPGDDDEESVSWSGDVSEQLRLLSSE